MRTVWRLCAERFAAGALSGEGARLFGGRWNRVGTPMVYCGSTLSLCALEILVHVTAVPSGFVSIPLVVPAGIEIERWDASSLPPDWRTMPGGAALAAMGTEWARSGRTVALEVPSAVVASETNVLLNPMHPDIAKLTIGDAEPFPFDPRLK